MTRSEKGTALAERIKWGMKQKGLNKSEFARLVGVQNSIVTRWLTGNHNFTLYTIVKIEIALEINLIVIY